MCARIFAAFFMCVMAYPALAEEPEEPSEVFGRLLRPATAGQPEAAPARTNPCPLCGRYGPLDVEVAMRDGSIVRGKLRSEAAFEVKTAYGLLSVPFSEMRRYRRGDKLSGAEIREMQASIAALEDEDFEKREDAQARLVMMGPRIVPNLEQAEKSAQAERRMRLGKVLKVLGEQDFVAQPLDLVKTRVFEAAGELTNTTLPIEAVFGSFDARLDQVVSIRWLAYGERKQLEVTPGEACLKWLDTGLDLDSGDELALAAGGSIQLSNYVIAPSGNPAWGQTQPYLVGTLVGRIGGGETFAVNEGVRLTAPRGGRLYLQIHTQPNMQGQVPQMQGHFKVEIATGSMAAELRVK